MKISGFRLAFALCLFTGMGVNAESTNETGNGNSSTTATESAPAKLDESAFQIISERNIFNANRSGGTVRSTSSRRPVLVETFALTGTMAYEKGVFAFFEGSSTEFTKALKPNGVIAGYKLVDILANGVKLEMDGQITELHVGTGMRREDQGTWKFTEMVAAANSSGGYSEANNRYSRGDRNDRGRRGDDGSSERNGGRSSENSNSNTASSSPAATADQSEILKRLMERREKESQ